MLDETSLWFDFISGGESKGTFGNGLQNKNKKKVLVHIFFYFWLLRKVLILFIK